VVSISGPHAEASRSSQNHLPTLSCFTVGTLCKVLSRPKMSKLTNVVIFVLIAFVQLGSCLQCYKCSGDSTECNSGAAKETCLTGFTSCASLVLNSAESMHFMFGCAKPQDCDAAAALCTEVTKDGSQITCNATCCSGNNCVTPYPKAHKPRKCYECASMAECDAATPKVCPNVDDRCYKVSTEVTHKEVNVELTTYSKGCATKSQCDNKDAHFFYQTCAADDDSSCDMTCCEGDMCNAGSNFVVSAFTLLACALFAVVRL